MDETQSVEVQLSDRNGRALAVANVLLEIQFFTRGRFRYAFPLGRTDSEGRLRTTYAEIEGSRQRNAQQNLMDYNTPLKDRDSSVRISIPSDQQLRERFENAMRSYGGPPGWASNWPSNGQVHPDEQTVPLAEGITSIQLRAG